VGRYNPRRSHHYFSTGHSIGALQVVSTQLWPFQCVAACSLKLSAMRPLPGADALPSSVKPRSRKSSVGHAGVASNVPTAFFIRSEEELEKSVASSTSTHTAGGPRDTTFGVQSLADTLEAAFGLESTVADKRTGSKRSAQYQKKKSASRTGSHSSDTSAVQLPNTHNPSPARKLRRKLSSHASSTPLTPLNVDAPSPLPTSGMPSTPSAISLQSLKLSDEDSNMDESASQAITSSGEEDAVELTAQPELMGTFPQLVMPIIQMPSRRPFTTKGKAMGKLRVMVAGESGAYLDSVFQAIIPGLLLTIYDRHRKDVPCPFNSTTLRRHRACRPSIDFRLVFSTITTPVEVP
jgi:hypothetical protein